jgi:hypothetical protein
MSQRRLVHPVQLSEEQQNLIIARKDAASGLIVWVLLEGLSLLLLPNFQLISGTNKLPIWLAITIPTGMVGAVLIGVSSWWVKWTQEKINRQAQNKEFYSTLAQSVGFLGLIGIGLPMIVVGLELWITMLSGPNR